MSERSVHDNNVYAYVVLCDERQIVLHTEFKEGTPEEYTDVIFSSVAAHHFENVLSGNILFGIEEVDVATLVSDWSHLFAQMKDYGWPDSIKYTDPAELMAVLKQRGVKAFEIGSSHGLSGWVLAQSMEVRQRNGRAKGG